MSTLNEVATSGNFTAICFSLMLLCREKERERMILMCYFWPYFLTFSLWNLHAVLISCFSQNKKVKQQSPLLCNKSRLTDFRNHTKYTFLQSWHMCTYDFPNLSRVTQYQLAAMKTLLTALAEYTAKKGFFQGGCAQTQEIHDSRTAPQHLFHPALVCVFVMWCALKNRCCILKDKRKLRWESCEEIRWEETKWSVMRNKNRQEKIWRDQKMNREQKRRYETRWENRWQDQKKNEIKWEKNEMRQDGKKREKLEQKKEMRTK